MKNLIENSISWNRLGRRSKSEYEFAIEKAVMSREDNTFEMDIKAIKFLTNNICEYPTKTIDLRLSE